MKKFIYINLFILLSVCFSFSQNIISVSPGDGTLKAAIKDAPTGSILRLIPGTEYTESTDYNFPINKVITIEVDGDESSVKPKIKTKASDATSVASYFILSKGASITLRGLEFDGTQSVAANNTNYLIRFDVGSVPATTNIGTIKIVNCNIHDFVKDVIEAQTSTYAGYLIVDSVIVNNTVTRNTGPVVHFKTGNPKYVEVKNSTFSKFSSYGIRIMGTADTKQDIACTGIVDKVTMDNIVTTFKNFILAQDHKGKWTVTNSIFTNNGDQTQKGIYWKNTDTATVTNICYYLTGIRLGVSNYGSCAKYKDTLYMDPGYADQPNGDYTLPKNSALFTMSTTKGPIGDPRWLKNAPNAVEKLSTKPSKIALDQNYPNPFNPSTKISFSVKNSGKVVLSIYNILGNKVKDIVNEPLAAGSYSVEFNAKNLPSGIYFYRLSTVDGNITRKMTLIK
jgi:hypothetical protein